MNSISLVDTIAASRLYWASGGKEGSIADLSWGDLAGVDLTGAKLAGINLTGADLTGADLTGADLTGADLTGADLTGAKLPRADLSWGCLSWADLSWADLAGTKLTKNDLTGTDLTGADLAGADLAGTDLTSANLAVIREDFWSILSQAPNEVQGVAAALNDGRVDGSTYSDGDCHCLIGTIANIRGVRYDLTGISLRPSRPAERWFLGISPGHTPKNSPIAAITAGWVEEWQSKNGS